jgi:hypothetical protein
MANTPPNISVNVDLTNPGQFFACCGLLELADRLWPGSEGYFAEDGLSFSIEAPNKTLSDLINAIAYASMRHIDVSDPYSSPIEIGAPFRPLVIDWWNHDFHGARDLKVWAGKMESYGIARALQHSLRRDALHSHDLFNIGFVVMNTDGDAKKREPYYFDSRRAPNAHSIDVGFSTNDIGVTSTAHPAVELLCLIGLQTARPATTNEKRIYEYFPWSIPLPASLILPAATGIIRSKKTTGYRFENWFRTGQKKHKAFRSAIPLPPHGD